MFGNSLEFLGIPSPNLPWKFTPLFLGIPRKKFLGIPKAISQGKGTQPLHLRYVSEFFVISHEKLNLALAAKTSEVKTDVTIILYDAGRASPARDDRLTRCHISFFSDPCLPPRWRKIVTGLSREQGGERLSKPEAFPASLCTCLVPTSARPKLVHDAPDLGRAEEIMHSQQLP